MAPQFHNEITKLQVQTQRSRDRKMLKSRIEGPISKIPIHVNGQKSNVQANSYMQADGQNRKLK